MSYASLESESWLTESDLGDYRSEIPQSEVNDVYSLAPDRQNDPINHEANKEIRLLKDAHYYLSKTISKQEKQITDLEKNAEKEKNYREILQREVDDLRALIKGSVNMQPQRAIRPPFEPGVSEGRTGIRVIPHTGVGNPDSENNENHGGLPASLAESESFCTDTTSKSMSGEIRMKFETQELKYKTLENKYEEMEKCYYELSGKLNKKKMAIKSIETHVDILKTRETETKDTLETILRNQREIYEDVQMNIDRVTSLALFEPKMGKFIEDRPGPHESTNTDK